jgi:FkbM family methyltransferase
LQTVVFYPVVENQSDLVNLISRASWFLSLNSVGSILVGVSTDLLLQDPWHVSAGMDASIEERFPSMQAKTDIKVINDHDLLFQCKQSEIVLCWKQNAETSAVLEPLRNSVKLWYVDPLNSRMEGSLYIEAGLSLREKPEVIIEKNRARFKFLTERLGNFSKAYLMATGPSVSRYRLFDYDDSISIVCNSVILDDELMAFVKPKIVVFADPIFHFGPSQYASEFRASLKKAANRHEFFIVIPIKYYEIFIESMPELVDRLVAIPFENMEYNFDLRDSFKVKTTANILTLLMIPLATTFSKNIYVLGCNGRPLTEDNYFWSHNPGTQINGKMENIKNIHPGFFNIDYNDYYLEHCESLDDQLSKAENNGIRFSSTGHSHIPALAKRSFDEPITRLVDKPVKRVILLDPDVKSNHGHYLAYDQNLSLALKKYGVDVEVACRVDTANSLLQSMPNFSPVFMTHSWAVGNRVHNDLELENFEDEMEVFLSERCQTDEPMLYMYCGSLEHVDIFLKLRKKYRFNININLFYLSFRISEEYITGKKDLVLLLDQNLTNTEFTVTVPTKEVQAELARLGGVILPVAPHPSTGVSDDFFETYCKNIRGKSHTKKFSVLYPGASTEGKGIRASCGSMELLAEDEDVSVLFKCQDFGSLEVDLQDRMTATLKKIQIFDREINSEELDALFVKSDIAVIPYDKGGFSNRTSGLLIDSIYYGIPCVVVEGTWLASFVKLHECGVVVEEDDAELLSRGVYQIIEKYEFYHSNACSAAEKHFSRNSWVQLASSVMNISEPSTIPRKALVGPYNRGHAMHWDEINLIADLFGKGSLNGAVMIDVGAHHGSALLPFLNMGWSVFAFEPDNKNREELHRRIDSHEKIENLVLDTRCLGNKVIEGQPFFRSPQSTGISGLSSFHDTHSEEQSVDVTTLEVFFADRDLENVDFLKIDTEGHDLFVLEGFPWERAKPAVIECEFEDNKTLTLGYTFYDLAEFLCNKGYRVWVSEWHPILRYGIQHDWNQFVEYPCSLRNDNGWGNLVAFRDTVDPSHLKQYIQMRVKSKIGGPANTDLEAVGGRELASLLPNRWVERVPRCRSFDRKMIVPYVHLDESLGPVCSIVFIATVDCSVVLDYFDGSSKQILNLSANRPSLIARKLGKTNTSMTIGVLVENKRSWGDNTHTIECLFSGIYKTVEEMREIYENRIDARLANTFYRKGDFGEAFVLNMTLLKESGLQTFLDNSKRCTEQLGNDFRTDEDFLRLVASS